MENGKLLRFKIFLWDQFIRPIYALSNINIIKITLLVLLFVFIIVNAPIGSVYIVGVMLLVIFIYEIIKYYKSGEFIGNYRKYKYPEYKRATKIFKKENNENGQREIQGQEN